MTIRQLFPFLNDSDLCRIGRRFINCYRALHQRQSPSKVFEYPYSVYDYPQEFIDKRLIKLKNRYAKQYPDVDVSQAVKQKRKRITTGFAQLVNPDSTKEKESKNKC